MAATRVGVRQRGIANRDGDGLCADRSVRCRARACIRHPAEPQLPGKGTRPLQGPHARRARRAAERPGFPAAGALFEGDVRQPSGVERRADARVAGENHARDARRVSQEQLRARPRHHRGVRRHHARRSPHEIRGRAEGWVEERKAAPRRRRSARPRPDEDLARQSPRVGADRLSCSASLRSTACIPTTTRCR